MTKKQKLELTWIGKENRPKLEPRILLEDAARSYHAAQRVAESDIFDNRLAPSLLEKDKWGNWVINTDYNAAMLAEAVCKLEGFIYAPSDAVYWQHGHSSERDFIYGTTQTLGHEQLQQISDEVGEQRTLLICCAAFRGKADRYANLTLKKIPNAVLKRCEWGHDDYSLKVENLPQAAPSPPSGFAPLTSLSPQAREGSTANPEQQLLFGDEGAK